MVRTHLDTAIGVLAAGLAVACSPHRGPKTGLLDDSVCASFPDAACFTEVPRGPPLVDRDRIYVLTWDGFGESPAPHLTPEHFAIVEFTAAGRRVVASGECPDRAWPERLGRTGAGSLTVLCSDNTKSRDHAFGIVGATGGVTWLAREPRPEEPQGPVFVGRSTLRYVVPLEDRLVLLFEKLGTKGIRATRWRLGVIPRTGGSLALPAAGPLRPLCLADELECADHLVALVMVGDRLHVVLSAHDEPLAKVADFVVAPDGAVAGAALDVAAEFSKETPCLVETPDGTVIVTAGAPSSRASLRFPGGSLPYGPDVFGSDPDCTPRKLPTPRSDADPPLEPEWVRATESGGKELVVYTIPAVRLRHVPESDPRQYPGSFHVLRSPP